MIAPVLQCYPLITMNGEKQGWIAYIMDSEIEEDYVVVRNEYGEDQLFSTERMAIEVCKQLGLQTIRFQLPR